MRVDVSSICRQALSDAAAEAELDAAIERACLDLHGQEGQAQGVCLAVQQMVTHYARSRKVSRLEAARGLADATSILDITVRTGSGTLPPEMAEELLKDAEPGKPYIHTREVRQVWTSDDGTPPPEDLVRMLKGGLGRKRRVRTIVTLPGGVQMPGWAALLILLALVLGAFLFALWSARH